MVGRGAALFDGFGLHVAGILGWCMWLAVHLFYLPGLRNRLMVLLNWLSTIITGEASVRMTLPATVVEDEAMPHEHRMPDSLPFRL